MTQDKKDTGRTNPPNNLGKENSSFDLLAFSHYIRKNVLEAAEPLLKLGYLFGSVAGFTYLFLYCAKNQIPIPLSLSELPTILLVLFIVASLLSLFFCGFAILPILGTRSITNDDYRKLFDFRKNKNFYVTKNNIIGFISIFGFPFFSFSFLLLAESIQWDSDLYEKIVHIFLPIILAIISAFTPVYFVRHKVKSEEINKAYKVVGTLLFASFYWYLFTTIILVLGLSKLIPNVSMWFGIVIFLICSSILLMLLYLMIIPWTANENKITWGWIKFAILCITLPPIITPVSLLISSDSLGIMRIGGGYKTIYLIDQKYVSILPKEIISNKKPSQTKLLRVVLDVGDKVYVRTLTSDRPVYVIPRTDIVGQIL